MAWEATAVGRRLSVGDDEGRLVRGAAAGESWAVAALYQRYEDRLFNVALRITGDERDAADATREAFLRVLARLPATPDRERHFGARLLAAAREAGHDAMEGRRAAEPSEPGGDGPGQHAAMGDEDGRPLLVDWQDRIRATHARLGASQREALALREPGGLSYGEIAQIMQVDHDSVAELIATARIALHDELRGAELAADPPASEECEPALQLIAMRDDRELADDSEDAEWLIEHLAACRECRVYLDAMQEARLAYSDWQPVAAPAALFAETMAGAAAIGAPDDGARGAHAATAESGAEDATLPSFPAPSADERRRRRRREVLLAGGWAGVFLVGVLAVLVGGVFDNAEGEDRPPEPRLDSPATAQPPAARPTPPRRKRAKKREREAELPSRSQPVVEQQPAPRPPVVVVAPRPREPRRTARRPRARRPQSGGPRARPPEPGPAPQQQPPAAPAPEGTGPTTPAPPASQQPPNGRCPNPAGEPTPC